MFVQSFEMEKRHLGNSDLQVTPLCLGCNVFGWTIDEKKSFEILDAFVAKGHNFIDTADIYSVWATGEFGSSETIIGNWMKARNNRDKIVLATKCGMIDMQGGINISKKYIIEAAERSLKRLQTDHIDLYQTHKDDGKTPVEETLEAHQQLIKEGKVRVIGASNFFATRLKEALDASKKHGLPRYETLQPLYNLYDREVFEKELEKVCLDNNLSVINYYSLAAGFLSGKYRNESDATGKARGGRAKQYLNERGFRILKAMDEVAAEYKTTNSSVAIAWLLTRKAVAAPIASATSLSQLEELFKGVELTLSESAIEKLNAASAW
jgi:aryl-alcohol dehydrogenase-like predicted oxidoreductase